MSKKSAIILIIIIGAFALYNNISWFMKYIYPLKYEESVIRYATEYNVDPYLVASVIKVESNFSPKAVSTQGAIGLMQLMPETALWAAEKMGIQNIDISDINNPDLNIRIGTWYLASLLNEFDDNIILALAAYNGGRGNVAEWQAQGSFEEKTIDEIPFSETRNFVAKVIKSYEWYKRLYKL